MNGINKEISNQIIELIIQYKKPEKIVIFGSRAVEGFKTASDIDIAIFGKDWTDRDVNLVKHALDEEIKTPLKFDVVNFYSITKDALRKEISERGEIVYESEKN